MSRQKKPKQYVGKVVITIDFIRLESARGDARELTPLRERLMVAVDEIMGEVPCVRGWETRSRLRPKNLTYADEQDAVASWCNAPADNSSHLTEEVINDCIRATEAHNGRPPQPEDRQYAALKDAALRIWEEGE